ncbi:MAG: hypothetical protein ACKOET_08235, partial [Verrucomicrobiota bacterium]
SIDSGREAANDRQDQAAGLMTRSEHYGARGRDWQTDVTQCFREERYVIQQAQALAADTGVPVETILARFGYETNPNTPAGQQDGPSGQPDAGNDPSNDAPA